MEDYDAGTVGGYDLGYLDHDDSSTGAGAKVTLSSSPMVFRVRATRLDRSIPRAVVLSLCVLVPLAVILSEPALLAALPVWPLFTWLRSERVRADYCCDSACDTVIPIESERCPGCERPVRGEIAHRDDRLAAEEQVERPGYGFKPLN